MKRIHRLHTYLKIDLSKRSLFPSFEILVRAELRTEYVLSHRYFRESEDESERAWRQIALKRRSAITRRAMNNESTRDQSGKRSAPPPLSLSLFLSRNKIARSPAKYSRSRRERWRGKVEKVGEEEVN